MAVRKANQISKFSTKRENADAATSAKVKLRRNVLEAVGKPAHVFDAFAGPGVMYAEVWREADSYVGCDKRSYVDERMMFCADSARVMRAIDLQRFNIFDLDSFGSPYEQVIIMAARRKVAKDELIGMLITDGTELQLKMNAFPIAVGQLAGLRAGQVGVAGNADFIMTRIINGIAKRTNCDIVKRWQVENRSVGKTGGASGIRMRYIGLVLRGR